MSEQKDKTPEQVSDEDYKVAPTSADEESLKKHQGDVYKKEQQQNKQLAKTISFPQIQR